MRAHLSLSRESHAAGLRGSCHATRVSTEAPYRGLEIPPESLPQEPPCVDSGSASVPGMGSVLCLNLNTGDVLLLLHAPIMQETSEPFHRQTHLPTHAKKNFKPQLRGVWGFSPEPSTA